MPTEGEVRLSRCRRGKGSRLVEISKASSEVFVGDILSVVVGLVCTILTKWVSVCLN